MRIDRILALAGVVVMAGAGPLAVEPAAHAAFTGTNGVIVFASTRPQANAGTSPSLWEVTVRADGTTTSGDPNSDPNQTHQLTAGANLGNASTAGDDSEPYVSQDGTNVYFSSNRQTSGHFQIFKIGVTPALNGDGTDNAVEISQPASDTTDNDYAPSIASDNCTLYFDRNNTSIWTENACAATPASTAALVKSGLTLGTTQSDGETSRVVVSPVDPTKLLYVQSNQIHLLSGVPGGPLADTNLSAVTSATAADANPDWSPNGAQIIFDSDRAGGTSRQMWVMTANGTAVAQLVATTANDLQPVFSPDGSHVAFDQKNNGLDIDSESISVSTGGSGLSQGNLATLKDMTLAAAGAPQDNQPDWQPLPIGAQLPEAPYAVLLPGGALLLAGAALAWRRRRLALASA